MPAVKETDLAWAAGFLDGDGCLQLYCRSFKSPVRKTAYGVVQGIQATQVHRAPILRLKELFGGTVTRSKCFKKRGRREVWRWSRQGRKAVEIIEKVRPYLVGKLDEAKIILDFQHHCRRLRPRTDRGGHFVRLTDFELAVQCWWRDRLSEVKHART